MLEVVEIPEGVDGLPQVLIWEADEFMVAIIIFYGGLVSHQIFITIILIVIFTRFYSSFKNKHLPGFYLHAPYRIGLIQLNKRFPNGSILEYHE